MLKETKIIVTPDIYSGGQGLQNMLNDYYEDEITELEPEDQDKARRFIEDGLIEGGRRIGIYEGREKKLFGIEKELLEQLTESRLVRVEETHLGKHFEICHDAMVDPILKSKAKRKAKERKLALEKEQFALEQKRIAQQKENKKKTIRNLGLLTLALAILSFGLYLNWKAKISQDKADLNQKKAERSDRIANVRLAKLHQQEIDFFIERYDKFIASGEGSLKNNEFEKAEASFEESKLTLFRFQQSIEKDTLLQDIERDSLLKEIAFRLSTVDTLINKNREKIGVNERYDSLLNYGNNAFNQERYIDAFRLYGETLETNFNNVVAITKLEQAKLKIEQKCDLWIRVGDEQYKSGEIDRNRNKIFYRDALDSYQKASKLAQLINKSEKITDIILAKMRTCEKVLSKKTTG